MSKIFEAIQKGSGGAGDLLPALLKDQPAPVKSAAVPPAPVSHAPAASEAIPHVIADFDVDSKERVVSLQIQSDAPVLIFDQPRNRAGEQYRVLRTKILHHPAHPKLILVSSPGPGDGKTVTAINLAGALSLKVEAKVLLVDADFRRSAMHKELGLPKEPGLTDVLVGAVPLRSAVIRTQQYPNLCVLTAGSMKLNPAELLDSPVWKDLIGQLREEFEFIVLDSPPNAAMADYLLLQAACDGVVTVLRPDHTNRKASQATLQAIPSGKNLGVVMNCVPNWFLGGGSKSGYYYYGEEEG